MDASVVVGWYLVSLATQLANGSSMEDTPVTVTRRRSTDVYHLYQHSMPSTCTDSGTSTYLVGDRQCVDDDQLINECYFVITPHGDPSFSTLVLTFENGGLTTAMTYSMNDTLTPARVVELMDTTGPMNGSLCHIISLEVYQGQRKSFNISYRGLSLDNSGEIKIKEAELAYDSLDYMGEVYRMNLLCSNETNGCLFFKTLGTTELTNGKFNGTVPGISLSQRVESTTAPTTPTTKNPLHFTYGSPLFYSVLVVGSAAIGVLSCLIIVCLILQCKSQRHRKNLFIIRKDPGVQVQRAQSTIYDDVVLIRAENVSENAQEEVVAVQNEAKPIPSYEECGIVTVQNEAKPIPSYEECDVPSDRNTKPPRKPTEAYSMLVQVGGRNSFSDFEEVPHPLVNEESAYAQLHETSL